MKIDINLFNKARINCFTCNNKINISYGKVIGSKIKFIHPACNSALGHYRATLMKVLTLDSLTIYDLSDELFCIPKNLIYARIEYDFKRINISIGSFACKFPLRSQYCDAEGLITHNGIQTIAHKAKIINHLK